MKNAFQPTEVSTTLEMKPVTLADSAVGHVIRTVATMYSHPIASVLREYTANMLDVHTRHQVSRPAEIHLPTSSNPTLRFTNYGVGASAQIIENYLFGYGQSDKRSSNSESGFWGYGSKCGFTVADQIIVEAVHQGRRTYGLLTMENYSITDGGETEDEDYTTITIPVDIGTYPTQQWSNTIQTLFIAITNDRLSVFTNGSPLTRYTVESHFYHWGDGFYFTPFKTFRGDVDLIIDEVSKTHQYTRRGYSRMSLSTGSMPVIDISAVSQKVINKLSDRKVYDNDLARNLAKNLIAFTGFHLDCPIGSIKMTPSRESLVDNAENVDYLTERVYTFAVKLADSLWDFLIRQDPVRVRQIIRRGYIWSSLGSNALDSFSKTKSNSVTVYNNVSPIRRHYQVLFSMLRYVMSETVHNPHLSFDSLWEKYRPAMLIPGRDLSRIDSSEARLSYIKNPHDHHPLGARGQAHPHPWVKSLKFSQWSMPSPLYYPDYLITCDDPATLSTKDRKVLEAYYMKHLYTDHTRNAPWVTILPHQHEGFPFVREPKHVLTLESIYESLGEDVDDLLKDEDPEDALGFWPLVIIDHVPFNNTQLKQASALATYLGEEDMYADLVDYVTYRQSAQDLRAWIDSGKKLMVMLGTRFSTHTDGQRLIGGIDHYVKGTVLLVVLTKSEYKAFEALGIEHEVCEFKASKLKNAGVLQRYPFLLENVDGDTSLTSLLKLSAVDRRKLSFFNRVRIGKENMTDITTYHSPLAKKIARMYLDYLRLPTYLLWQQHWRRTIDTLPPKSKAYKYLGSTLLGTYALNNGSFYHQYLKDIL